VRAACLGKTSCTVEASNAVFSDPCLGTPKQLAVTYTCGGSATTRFPIPDQLPDPERTPPDMSKPVKVYILSGQSNMVGMGDLGPLGTQGTLETLVKSNKKFPNLIDESGAWTVRNDVWYKGVVSAGANKWLTVGCGAGSGQIGPELGFGHVMGYFHGEPVLIIKASQGNRSLAWDLLPPGSRRYTVDGRTYAGYGDGDDSWSDSDPYKDVGTWYAGKQYDDFVAEIHEVLDNFGTNFPQFKSQGYEIAGFAWFQGHKDTGSAVHASRYEVNLVNFIRAFRAELKAPKAPFVIATIGFDGWKMSGNALTVANAQLAVSGEKGKYPDFVGNVLTVETRGYWRDVTVSPKNQGYHYHRNAETYYLVGEALGRGMAKLMASPNR
jgi:alpha-galactosidase